MAGQAKKSTKKFEKRHLKDVLERRKDVAKIKQRQQLKAKRKARKARDEGVVSDDVENESKKQGTKSSTDDLKSTLKDMTVDEFFQGALDIPQPKRNLSSSEKASVKRKLDALKDDQNASDLVSEPSDEVDPVASDSNSGSDSDQEADDHKEHLQALAEKDPEFYKYLKENDAELLAFKGDEEMEQWSDPDQPPKKKARASPAVGEDGEEDRNTQASSSEVSLAMVAKWKKAMLEQRSLRALREAVLAFRAAAHTNEDDDKHFKYNIASPEVYHQVLMVALQCAPEVLNHHLPVKEASSGRIRVTTDSKKYRTLSPLLNSHALAVLHLLQNLSDAPTLKITLSSLLPLLPYLLSFKKVLKNLLKAIAGIWSDPSTTEATRINAFLLVRRLAIIGDASLKEAVLKATYQGLVHGSRNTTVHTLAGINLMKNSAAELWGLDATLGYTTAFTYIRQLAIHLRSSISQPSKDSYKAIYNWQYTHSLDFWSRVLSAQCCTASNVAIKKPSDSQLHPLIYPLVQITLGAVRLIPTPIYFPLRFHLIRSLLRLSRSTNTYIPLAPALIEVLQSPELKENPKPSTLKPLDFTTLLRAPKSYLRSRIYQDGVGEQVTDLLAEFFGVWAKSIAFPELTIPPTVLLKRWLKEVSTAPGKDKNRVGVKGNRNHKLNTSVQLLLQKLTTNSTLIEDRRSRLDFSVSDRKGVEEFLRDTEWEEMPIGAFVTYLRKQREERERLLEQSRREEEKRRQDDNAGDSEKADAGFGTNDDSEEDEEDQKR